MAPKPKLSRPALELVAKRFRALSDPTRLQLLQELFEGELTVQELCERAGTGQANTSKHLATLAQQGLVARRKEGNFAYYRVADPTVYTLCELVCGSLAERFEETLRDLGQGH